MCDDSSNETVCTKEASDIFIIFVGFLTFYLYCFIISAGNKLPGVFTKMLCLLKTISPSAISVLLAAFSLWESKCVFVYLNTCLYNFLKEGREYKYSLEL